MSVKIRPHPGEDAMGASELSIVRIEKAIDLVFVREASAQIVNNWKIIRGIGQGLQQAGMRKSIHLFAAGHRRSPDSAYAVGQSQVDNQSCYVPPVFEDGIVAVDYFVMSL